LSNLKYLRGQVKILKNLKRFSEAENKIEKILRITKNIYGEKHI
jgi:hypothetical protein